MDYIRMDTMIPQLVHQLVQSQIWFQIVHFQKNMITYSQLGQFHIHRYKLMFSIWSIYLFWKGSIYNDIRTQDEWILGSRKQLNGDVTLLVETLGNLRFLTWHASKVYFTYLFTMRVNLSQFKSNLVSRTLKIYNYPKEYTLGYTSPFLAL